MKKAVSLIITLILLIGCISASFVPSAVGISLSAGKDALVSQWTKGKSGDIDYRYFSPVQNGGEAKKYPLVVMLHGKYSGTHEGEQISVFEDVAATDAEREYKEALYKREKRKQNALIDIKRRFGKNSILKGFNFEEGATAIARNSQIGGHKA